MKTLALSFVVSTLAILGLSSAKAQDELLYVAVKPCRIVDTREGLGLPIPANDHRNFLVSGTAGELFDQGGSQSGGCPNPKPEKTPLAISAYVIAVPAESSTDKGVLAAYPSDQPEPPVGEGSTVNFDEGQTIGNTTNIALCDPANCPADGQFAIISRKTDEHVVVDVQGYFYPATVPAVEYVYKTFQIANPESRFVQTVDCPQGKIAIGGGGVVGSPEHTWYIAGLSLSSTGNSRTWQVVFETVTGTAALATGNVYTFCTTGNFSASPQQ